MSVVEAFQREGFPLETRTPYCFNCKFHILCTRIFNVELLHSVKEKLVFPRGQKLTDCYLKGMEGMDLTVPHSWFILDLQWWELKLTQAYLEACANMFCSSNKKDLMDKSKSKVWSHMNLVGGSTSETQ